MATKKAFFAYPGGFPLVAESIKVAIAATKSIDITPWQTMGITGLKLDNKIRAQIDASDLLIADITYPNFNVYYEIGFCIGRSKPVIPTVNFAHSSANSNVSLTGLFDTVGQIRYQNGIQLADLLSSAQADAWANHYIKDKNYNEPLFVQDTLLKIEFRQYIFDTIQHSGVEKRVYDPDETPTLTLTTAVGDISSSTGAIIPLLSEHIEDSQRHNLRSAFLAGLSHGFGLEPLIIQYEDQPAPLDFRDRVVTVRTKLEIENAVERYCQKTLVRNQSRKISGQRARATLLERIDLGASAAEKEQKRLSSYFVRTAEYSRALRADGALVVGRKGSGKSAIFFSIIDRHEDNKQKAVIDLKPASHNLSELRETLLSVMSVGVFDHTIAAFWQYIIYVEILLGLRERALERAKFNFSRLKEISEIERQFELTDEMVSGDFTARLDMAVRSVIETVGKLRGAADLRSKLTNILFETKISLLRNAVATLAKDYDSIDLLFDNIDKGWPARGVEPHDIRTIRHLIDVLTQIQRDLRRKETAFSYLLFMRSDVYDQLNEETPDRGKYNVIRVDWSDPAQLRYLLQQRVTSNVPQEQSSQAWTALNPQLPEGVDAISAMIDASLMRPRFLIDLAERALSFAVNRGHESVAPEDVQSALEKHSVYLVTDFGYELRDVSGIDEKIFYQFLGEGSSLNEGDVRRIIERKKQTTDTDKIISLLLWYGFLGISASDQKAVFIYDRDYDQARLEAERDRLGAELRYTINPAFLRGLEP